MENAILVQNPTSEVLSRIEHANKVKAKAKQLAKARQDKKDAKKKGLGVNPFKEVLG